MTRKSKKNTEIIILRENTDSNEENNNSIENIQIEIVPETETLKKRGRKPKGGKLIVKSTEIENKIIQPPNIILHLKCSSSDLNDYNTQLDSQITDPLAYKPLPPPEIMTYNEYDTDTIFTKYHSNNTNNTNNTSTNNTSTNNSGQTAYLTQNEISVCKTCNQTPDIDNDSTVLMKDITMKLKHLRIQYFKNTLHDKKSACFWCTYEYDSPPCYIPKNELDTSVTGYGSFCRPECAVGYLMKEPIDDSTKFERYHLLNRIYSKVYGFKKNIKPAPNPYYLLDKFYGSLTIQEYRKLLNSAHMLLVLEKPMTRILPELHEDNEEFILNIYGSATEQSNQKSGGMYKVKRQSEKQQGPTKSSIMKDKFGISN
jgi:hypothetical protein